MVGYDSIIPPGRVGKITEKVNLEGLHGGPFRKSATVESNALNNPNISLVIKGEVKPIIGVSVSQVRLKNGAPLAQSETIIISSAKSDLKVEEVAFKTANAGGGGTVWQSSLPLYATFDFKRTTVKPKPDGYYDYALRMALQTKDARAQFGTFEIKTNHPDKPIISVTGTLDVK